MGFVGGGKGKLRCDVKAEGGIKLLKYIWDIKHWTPKTRRAHLIFSLFLFHLLLWDMPLGMHSPTHKAKHKQDGKELNKKQAAPHKFEDY